MSEKTDDEQWQEAWADDDGEEAFDTATSEPDEPDPEQPAASSSESAPPDNDSELESLKHKLRSAEGRLEKFEEHIDGLRDQISTREKPTEEPPSEEEPVLPDGWTKEDWDDYQADYPVQAELAEKQTKSVKELEQRLSRTEQELTVKEQQRVFDETIRKAHPDYDDLLASERDQIVRFIEGQKNPTLKAAYQAVYKGGDAPDIVNLVTDYKASKGSGKPNNKVDQRVDDALAIPGRSQQPTNLSARAGLPPEDDFSAGWEYFKDEAID